MQKVNYFFAIATNKRNINRLDASQVNVSKSIDVNFLNLGITVNSEGHPKCFTEAEKSRDLAEADFFKIPTGKLDRHTVVIAQSGSGKSFFLGRLIEELMIKTKSDA